MRTAAENSAISSSVSCREHRLLAKSNMALTRSSQPTGERKADTKVSKCRLKEKKEETLKSVKGIGRTERFEDLYAAVFAFEQNRVVERVERSAHSHQHHLQTT